MKINLNMKIDIILISFKKTPTLNSWNERNWKHLRRFTDLATYNLNFESSFLCTIFFYRIIRGMSYFVGDLLEKWRKGKETSKKLTSKRETETKVTCVIYALVILPPFSYNWAV